MSGVITKVPAEMFIRKLEHAFKFAAGQDVLLVPVRRHEVKELRRALENASTVDARRK